MKTTWVRKLLRLASICPALVLGAWLVGYTQRQAARPPAGLDQATAEASPHADPFQEPGLPVPHVIRITSKRIEMPVFKPIAPLPSQVASAATDRKGFEPHVADLLERWVVRSHELREEEPANP